MAKTQFPKESLISLFDNGLTGIVVNRESNYVDSFFKGNVSVTMAMPDLTDQI